MANSWLAGQIKCSLLERPSHTELLLEALTIGGGVGLAGLMRPLQCLLRLLAQVSGTF